MNREDRLTYDAQHLAFEGTPLADRFDRTSLMRETLEIAAHPSVFPIVGPIQVREGSVRSTQYNARVDVLAGIVTFAPNVMGRYVAVHELAHVAHHRSRLGGLSHGGEYRAVYAELIGIVYGYPYRDILWQAFTEMGAYVHPARLATAPEPVIDIDRLVDSAGGSRWL